MYFLVLLLDALGAIVMVALVRNFTQLNLPIALFFSVFPLGFALLSELLKLEALVTGTTERHRNIVKLMGFMLVLLILGLGAYFPFRELWATPEHGWTRPVLGWLAFISLLLVIIPIVQEVRSKTHIRYKKLKEGNI